MKVYAVERIAYDGYYGEIVLEYELFERFEEAVEAARKRAEELAEAGSARVGSSESNERAEFAVKTDYIVALFQVVPKKVGRCGIRREQQEERD